MESLVYYSKPLHMHKAYIDKFSDKNNLIKSENITKGCCFAIHQHLNENQINYVCENIKNFYKNINF